MRGAYFALCGLLFGLGLAVGGMTNPAKVQAFLDVSGDWDASLAFVLGGAVGSFALFARLVARRGTPLFGGAFPAPPKSRIDVPLVVGALIFGVGWGLVGFCPGPALANLALPRPAAWLFVPAMVAGMRVAQLGFASDRS